jgi:hypothetical protein
MQLGPIGLREIVFGSDWLRLVWIGPDWCRFSRRVSGPIWTNLDLGVRGGSAIWTNLDRQGPNSFG